MVISRKVIAAISITIRLKFLNKFHITQNKLGNSVLIAGRNIVFFILLLILLLLLLFLFKLILSSLYLFLIVSYHPFVFTNFLTRRIDYCSCKSHRIFSSRNFSSYNNANCCLHERRTLQLLKWRFPMKNTILCRRQY
jgi:hypothetical protein